MAEISSFFNSVEHDRKYFAEDFARHLKKYFTNGVFNNELAVVANNDMSITIKTGDANIEGYRYTNTTDLKKGIEVADGTLKRIDNVVLRLDLTNRLISAQIIKGTYSDTPSAPALVRSTTTYDIKLAEITVNNSVTSITQSAIKDTRQDTNLCGIVASTVKTLDITDVYNQLYTKYNELIEEHNNDWNTWYDFLKNNIDTWFEDVQQQYSDKLGEFETDFNKWFDNIKGHLDDDPATALARDISELEEKVNPLIEESANFVKDENYVHTDNNFSNEEKAKIATNATNIKTNADNITKIVNSTAKSFTTVFNKSNWVLNEGTQNYDYDFKKEEIKENHFVDLTMSIADQEKWPTTIEVNSYDGGIKVSTNEIPEEDVNVTVTYYLTNLELGGE